ncbi:hypothetical protein FA09DRAFT_127930 [Tilletiopsis washingtonensis]|uniref:Uncharacterized protein n=1 Tax=Tilletiopsis washingtonensis TaxID=58919 RepID=A0A316Z4J9_9BASI|nr:hypothetical protein FA09DRAFT_127930 [Tilletiopsis washingtonensis]PWN95852.1 hypothetical protein FA09DRAFT_127930 [Tilletiopsis washingtonensis]
MHARLCRLLPPMQPLSAAQALLPLRAPLLHQPLSDAAWRGPRVMRRCVPPNGRGASKQIEESGTLASPPRPRSPLCRRAPCACLSPKGTQGASHAALAPLFLPCATARRCGCCCRRGTRAGRTAA